MIAVKVGADVAINMLEGVERRLLEVLESIDTQKGSSS
jgi:hypothetical protein